MNFALSMQYQQLLGQLGEPLGHILMSGIPWFFVYASLGLIVALTIIGMMLKKKIMVRKHRHWNLLAKLTYVAIIVVLPLTAGCYGALRDIQQNIHASFEADLLPAITKQMPAFNAYLSTQAKAFEVGKVVSVKDLIDPLIQDLYYVPQSTSWWEKTKANMLNQFILQTAAQALTEGLQEKLIAQIELLGLGLTEHNFKGQNVDELTQLGTVVVTKFTTDAAKQIDFTNVNASLPQVLVDALSHAIDRYFNSLYLTILACLLLCLLMVAAEVLYYQRYMRLLSQKPNAIDITQD
jgi:hypothetical protein